jgi:hypothetical protein
VATGGQSTGASAGTLQAGSVAADAPVRVLSDGDDAAGQSTAGSNAGQTSEENLGAAQVGSGTANAPVRVLSDGDNGGTSHAAAAGGDQQVAGSGAVAQIGSAGVNAPVRVLSDGGDAGADAGGGSQSVQGSIGGAQAGSGTLNAPVRVASDGDGGSPSAGPAPGGQTAAGSEGVTQAGSAGVEAPVSVLSADEELPDTTGGDGGAAVVVEVLDELLDRGIRAAAAALGSTTDGTVAAPVADGVVRFLEAGAAAVRDTVSDAAGSPSSGGDAGTLADAGETGDAVLDGDDGEGELPSGAGVAPAALVDVAGTLPLTGIPVWLLLAAGLWTLGAGLMLLLFAGRHTAP